MTRRFERCALIVATGLVAGLCGVALAATLPSAELIVAKTSAVDVGNLTQTLSIRARDTQHMASVKHTAADLWQTFERLGYDLPWFQ